MMSEFAPRHCPDCNCDLRARLAPKFCPECGFEFDEYPQIWLATRPPPGATFRGCMAVFSAVAFLAFLFCEYPKMGAAWSFAPKRLLALSPMAASAVVCALAWRSRRRRSRFVTLDASGVRYRNFLHTRLVPWKEIVGLRRKKDGVVLQTSDGRGVPFTVRGLFSSHPSVYMIFDDHRELVEFVTSLEHACKRFGAPLTEAS